MVLANKAPAMDVGFMKPEIRCIVKSSFKYGEGPVLTSANLVKPSTDYFND